MQTNYLVHPAAAAQVEVDAIDFDVAARAIARASRSTPELNAAALERFRLAADQINRIVAETPAERRRAIIAHARGLWKWAADQAQLSEHRFAFLILDRLPQTLHDAGK